LSGAAGFRSMMLSRRHPQCESRARASAVRAVLHPDRDVFPSPRSSPDARFGIFLARREGDPPQMPAHGTLML